MNMPWRDRAGRFSALKAAALVLLLLPGLWLACRWTAFGLGPRPVTEAIHQTGDWAVRILIATLAVSPAQRIFSWPKVATLRRMLGLSALAYAVLHFSLYVLDQKLDLAKVASEIAVRFYLAVGFTALVGLSLLGLTSTDRAIRRLGRNWNRLHRIVHALAALALLHYFLQSKLDVSAAVLMTGFFLWLMAYRLLRLRIRAPGFLWLVGLSVGAGLATALVEAAWYAIRTGVPAGRVLAANLGFAIGIRPAWWVLGVGLAVGLAQLARSALAARTGKRSRRTRPSVDAVGNPDQGNLGAEAHP